MMDPKYESSVTCETRQNATSVTEKHWNTDSENAEIQNYPNSFTIEATRAAAGITPNIHPAPRLSRSGHSYARHGDWVGRPERHLKLHGGTTSAHRFLVTPAPVDPT